jgi:diguanylate cyclase (GGDEF)-like protein
VTELERATRRADRERRARLAAEEIAERATRDLYDTVRDLREAEARARIVGETAVEVFTAPLALPETLAGIAASAERALGARRVTCVPCPPGRQADAVPDADDAAGGVVALGLSHASIAEDGREALLGVLRIELPEARLLTDGELLVARSLAALASMALANARLHAQTLRSLADAERRAASDPLTGLANHRAFQERLASEVQRAVRHRRPLALAVIDLDHFKRVNDTHGHQVGDRVLVEAGRILRERSRTVDLVARMGGEEFAWLMPETDAASAWEAADRAREAIAAHAFEGVGRVTISAGVCDLAAAGEAERLFALADGALYYAKHRGRDLVVRYSADEVDVLSAEEHATRLERRQSLQSIRVLARVVDAKDPLTRLHSDRVAGHAVALATALGWDAARIARLHEAAIVHDVGKIGVPDAVLLKAGRLTPPERTAIERHAALGADIVEDVLDPEQVSWVRSHHERWGGGGYPDDIAGEAIPDGARVIAVADAWDVMTSERPYRDPVDPAAALEECCRHAGTQFDPLVVTALDRLHAAGALDPVPNPTVPEPVLGVEGRPTPR